MGFRMSSPERTRPQSLSKRTLIVQVAILCLSIIALATLVWDFPFPSPFIKPLLPPRLRWPTAQVEGWVESGNFNRGFVDYFGRDPERRVPAGRNMVSPADGLIQNIAFQDGTTYLVVGLSFWDVHVVRAPVAGIVTNIEPEGYSVVGSTATKDELK